MGSLVTLYITFDLGHIERPCQGHDHVKLMSRKPVEVANILLLNIGRKPYMMIWCRKPFMH